MCKKSEESNFGSYNNDFLYMILFRTPYEFWKTEDIVIKSYNVKLQINNECQD